MKRGLFLQRVCQKRAESVEIRTLTRGHGANDATRAYFIDSARLLLPPPSTHPPLRQWRMVGEGGRLYITDQASVHLSCSWVAAGGEEGKRKDEKDGKRRRRGVDVKREEG